MRLRFQRSEYIVAASDILEYKFHYTKDGNPATIIVGIHKDVTQAWGLPFWEDSRPKGFEIVVNTLFYFALEHLKRKASVTNIQEHESFQLDPSFAPQKPEFNLHDLPSPVDYEVSI